MSARRTALVLVVVITAGLLQVAAWAGEAVPATPAAPPAKTLTLDEAVTLAICNNPTVETANQEIRANAGIVMQAESLVAPQLNVTTTRTTPVDQPEFAFQAAGTAWETNLSLTQRLWTWGAVREGIRAADQLLSSSRKLYVRAQDQVAFAARRAYFAVLTAQEAVRVQYDILAAAKEQLRVATLRHEAGVAPRYDVLSAEARVALVEQQVATAVGAVNIAWTNLSQVLGVPVSPDTTLSSTRPETSEEPPLPELVSFALANRPDVLAAQALVTANQARFAAIRTANYPQISGLLSYSFVPDSTVQIGSDIVAVSQDSGLVALAVNWNVFDGGETAGEIQTAAARLEQSCQGLRQLQLEVEAEVKNAYYVIDTTRTQIVAAQKEVEQAQEAKRVADIRYQEGVSTSVEVLDAQQTLGNAQNRLNAAIFALNVARAELDLAAGRSLAQAIPAGPRRASERCN